VNVDDIMQAAPVIPVIVLGDKLDPAQLAETLVEAGLPVIEVTLRTPGALQAIKEMSEVPGAIVGAGTVLNEAQLARSIEAGSKFIVSPGLTNPMALAARDTGIAFLPGVATASDIMRGLDLGLTRFKFFPAEPSGGIPAVKALSAPFGEARFCPTGGIRSDTAAEWLAIPSILCVGGTWVVKPEDDDLNVIAERARAAAALAA